MGGRDDVLDDAFKVAQDFLSWDADGSDALGHQPGVAGCVALGAVAIFMGFAVDLYGEPEAGAEEIEHIGSGGVLVAEAKVAGALF